MKTAVLAHAIVFVMVVFLAGNVLAEDSVNGSSPTAPAACAMRYLDRNHDRVIDREELSAGRQLMDVLLVVSWQKCDADGDGKISLSELENAIARADTEAGISASQSDDAEALAALADATALDAVLDRLSADERYADEIAALRAAVDDLSDVEAVTTYVARYPARFPHLVPVVHSWKRYYLHRSWRYQNHRRRHAARVHRAAVRKHGQSAVGPKGVKKTGPHPKAGAGPKKAVRPHPAPGAKKAGGATAQPHRAVRRGGRRR